MNINVSVFRDELDKIRVIGEGGIFDPVALLSLLSGRVIIVGSNIAAEAGMRVSFGSGYIFDSHGHVRIMDSASWGGGTFGASLSGMVAIINAPCIEDVQGASLEIGGSYGVTPAFISLGVGYDFTVSLANRQYYGHIVSGGIGLGPIRAEAHVQISYTDVTSSNAGLLVRMLLGPLFGNVLNWILGYN